jgi:ABC-type phosphate transport system permease subunit
MFEHHKQPLISTQEFLKRLFRYAAGAFLLVGISWLIGILGYRILEGLPWIDATLNAAMILGGMGPVDQLHTTAGKLFASFYALFSGIIFLFSVGVLLAPIIHRLMHQFHQLKEEEKIK